MRLTDDQLRFIDTYLQNSDVIFIDVRAELTDHIASATEEMMQDCNLDFYDAFKAYMAKNKAGLLKSRGGSISGYFGSCMEFGKTLYRPYNLAIALLLFFVFRVIMHSGDRLNIMKAAHTALFSAILLCMLLQVLISYVIIKKRCYYLEKTAFILTVVYYADLAFNGFAVRDFYGGTVSLGIMFFLFLAFIMHYIRTIRKFRIHYL